MGQLYSLDELSLLVREPNSRTHIDEAIRAYDSGAYRAAVVSTWTAIAYDLVQKFRELANNGEQAAKVFIDSFDDAVRRNSLTELLRFENDLVERAASRDFEMLQPHEAELLERVRRDRHLCAHPAFTADEILFQPSPESVRTHIVHAVTLLLSHQAMQGKSVLERICNDVGSMSFPEDTPTATKYLAGRYFNSAKRSLIRNLTIVLLKSLLRPSPTLSDAAVLRTLNAISSTRGAEYKETLRDNLPRLVDGSTDGRLLNVFSLVAVSADAWSQVEESAQIRLLALVRKGMSQLPCTAAIMTGILRVPDAKQALTEAMPSLDSQLQTAILTVRPSKELVPLAIARFAASHSWRDAEDCASRLIVKYAPLLDTDDVRAVLKAAESNRQIHEASKMPELLCQAANRVGILELEESKRDWYAFIAFTQTRQSAPSYAELEGLIDEGPRYDLPF